MNYQAELKKKRYIPVTIVGGIFLIVLIFYLAFDLAYAGRVLPGVTLGGTDLAGIAMQKSEKIIGDLLDDASSRKMIFITNGSTVSYSLDTLGVFLDYDTTIRTVRRFGKDNNPLKGLVQKLKSILGRVQLRVAYNLSSSFDEIVLQLRDKINQEPIEAQVVVYQHKAEIKEAAVGQKLDEKLFRQLMDSRIAQLDFSPLKLPVVSFTPVLNTELAKIIAQKINQHLNASYTLTFKDQIFELKIDDLWNWLEVIADHGKFVVHLKESKLIQYFKDLEQQVNQPMQNAIFKMDGEKVIAFKPDQPGAVLRTKDAVQLVQSALLSSERELELPINYLEPKLKLTDLNDLGINELVARGTSNFRGSPHNRRHNIKIGAEHFNNMLIAPQITFSLNEALGLVDASTGYLPEFVIKGDETVPEYGGGLCQISTTAFRAILNGGYPVVERKNHLYRVIYYEPAGSDATIYSPHPDLKFVNDSPGYILIHTYIEGDNLYFDFYGTKMNHQVKIDGPYISNVTDYPEPVYIETSTIPEGEIKKIDSAHRGADAILYRYIYDDRGQQIRKDIFESHYVPWPAKYLVGVAEAPEVEADLENVLPEPSDSE